MRKILLWEKDDVYDEEDFVDEEDEEDEDGEHICMHHSGVINTNFGVFEVNGPDNPYETRDVYLANCNFDITKEDILEISKVVGVEGIRPLTRYSFTIIIGVMFYFEDVLNAINELLEVESLDFHNDISGGITEDNATLIKAILEKVKSEYFCAYIMPNGKELFEEYDKEEDMQEKMPFWVALSHLSEGILLSPKDKK